MVVEFTHFYYLASLTGLFVIAAFMGTLFGVIVGLLAHSFQRDGVELWPTSSLEQGGWRALIAGVGRPGAGRRTGRRKQKAKCVVS